MIQQIMLSNRSTYASLLQFLLVDHPVFMVDLQSVMLSISHSIGWRNNIDNMCKR